MERWNVVKIDWFRQGKILTFKACAASSCVAFLKSTPFTLNNWSPRFNSPPTSAGPPANMNDTKMPWPSSPPTILKPRPLDPFCMVIERVSLEWQNFFKSSSQSSQQLTSNEQKTNSSGLTPQNFSKRPHKTIRNSSLYRPKSYTHYRHSKLLKCCRFVHSTLKFKWSICLFHRFSQIINHEMHGTQTQIQIQLKKMHSHYNATGKFTKLKFAVIKLNSNQIVLCWKSFYNKRECVHNTNCFSLCYIYWIMNGIVTTSILFFFLL